MSLQLRSQQYFGIKFETVRNTAEMVPDIILKVSEDSVKLEKENDLDEIIYGNRDNNYENRFTKRSVKGKIVGRLNTRDLGHVLKGALSQPTSVTASGATTHTFNPSNLISGTPSTRLPTFTVFHSNGAWGHFKARGCVFNSITITIGENESTFEAEIMGLDEVEVTNTTEINNIKAAIVYTAPDPKFNFGNVVVRHAPNFAGLASGTVLNVKPDVTITINNNVSFDVSSNSTPFAETTNFDTYAGKFEASLEMSFFSRTESKIIYDAFFGTTVAAQNKSFEIRLENQSYGVLGASSLFNTLRFVIPMCLVKCEVSGGLNEPVGASLTLDGLVNTVAQGYSIQTQLINTIATY